MAKKLPYLKFYVNDWLADEALQACSLAARGLWIQLVCLMYKSEKRGCLAIGGKVPTCGQIARMARATPKEVGTLLDELNDMGVSSTDEDGFVYCRRMIRDFNLSEKRYKAGKNGGNPNLVNQKTENPAILVNQEPNQNVQEK